MFLKQSTAMDWLSSVLCSENQSGITQVSVYGLRSRTALQDQGLGRTHCMQSARTKLGWGNKQPSGGAFVMSTEGCSGRHLTSSLWDIPASFSSQTDRRPEHVTQPEVNSAGTHLYSTGMGNKATMDGGSRHWPECSPWPEKVEELFPAPSFPQPCHYY